MVNAGTYSYIFEDVPVRIFEVMTFQTYFNSLEVVTTPL
jgi:hypothetical protein